MKIYEYKSITDIPNEYIDRILIESYEYKTLEKYILNETSKELKFIKAKLKFNHKKYTKDEIKQLALSYINKDTKNRLYNVIANNLAIRIPKTISLNLKEKSIKVDIFDNEAEFIKNINNLLKVINVCELISYIRIKHETLYHLIGPIIKEWEDSTSYINLNMDKDIYKLEYDKMFSEKYDFKLDFNDSVVKNIDEKKSKVEIETKLELSNNDIVPSIEVITTELNKINSIFNKSIEDKAEKINLEKKLDEAKRDIDIANEELKDKESIIENLHATIKSKNNQENKLKLELGEMKKLIEKEKKLNSQQIKKLEKSAEESKTQLEKIQMSLYDMEKSIENEKIINKQLNEKYTSTKLELNNVKKSNSLLEKENKDLLAKIEELKSKIVTGETATTQDLPNNSIINTNDIDDPFAGILDNAPIFNR